MKYYASQICFKVTDIEKSMEFYTEKLGFRYMFTFDKPDGTPFMYYLQTGDKQYLELIPVKEIVKPDGAFHHLTYVVEDVESLAKEFLAKGVALYNGPKAANKPVLDVKELGKGGDGNTAFYIADPDGYSIEFMEFNPECPQLNK